jgi:hypothetical protein
MGQSNDPGSRREQTASTSYFNEAINEFFQNQGGYKGGVTKRLEDGEQWQERGTTSMRFRRAETSTMNIRWVHGCEKR